MNGKLDILDITPASIHERSPLYFGCKSMMDDLVDLFGLERERTAELNFVGAILIRRLAVHAARRRKFYLSIDHCLSKTSGSFIFFLTTYNNIL